LRHPAFRPLKRVTKDVWWRYKGRSIANPPLPADVRSVLFVCLGNICRSPFAAVLAERRARDWSIGAIRCSSAGIKTRQAAKPPVEAREVAATFGVSLDAHRPRPLTREVAEAHDMIVVMENSQRDLLHTLFPDLRDRIFLLSMFDACAVGTDRYNIADPFGQPRAAFEVCYLRIERAVVALIRSMHASEASSWIGSGTGR